MAGAFQSDFVQNNAFQVAIEGAFQSNFVQNDTFLIIVGRGLKMRLFNRTQFNMATETKPYRNQATETREVKP